MLVLLFFIAKLSETRSLCRTLAVSKLAFVPEFQNKTERSLRHGSWWADLTVCCCTANGVISQ